jgi:hypothetical protein
VAERDQASYKKVGAGGTALLLLTKKWLSKIGLAEHYRWVIAGQYFREAGIERTATA